MDVSGAKLVMLICVVCALLPRAALALSAKDIYKKAGPAVVLLLGSDDGKQGSGGTGSIVTADGKIITNAHVVLNAQDKPFKTQYIYMKPERITGDNARDLSNRHTGKVVAFSPPDELDLALVQMDHAPARLPTIAFADPDKVDVGDQVVAIGHPEQGGLWTLTTGAISTVIANYGRVKGKNVFQTEASVNRGNSGGPLLDNEGNMVGINTMIARQAADGVAITAVNFSLKSSVAVGWLSIQGMPLAYAPKGVEQPVAVAAGPKPVPSSGAQVESGPSPMASAKGPAPVVVAEKTPPKVEEARQLAQGAHDKASAEPAQKGKPFDPAKAKPAFVTQKRPFDLDSLRQSQMKELESIMDEMRPKKTGKASSSGDGLGLW